MAVELEGDESDSPKMTTWVQRSIEKVNRQVYKRVHKAAKDIAASVKDEITANMLAPKSGKQYTFTHPKTGKLVTYVASAPGEWPAKKTGNLLRWLDVRANFYNDKSKVIRIYIIVPSSKVQYKDDLEKVRPWFRSPDKVEAIKARIREELKRA